MILLGSTGSIGINTLKIANKFNINVETLVAGENYKLLNKQIKRHSPKIVVVANKKIKEKINFKGNVLVGNKGILQAISNSKSTFVLNALVGILGLAPSIKCIKLNKTLALANKESLVCAGKFLNTNKIIPIDSEHFSLKYLMQKNKKIKKLLIFASGGALRNLSAKSLKNVSIKDALSHPNWSMGNKITIDSATMTNKLFELIEARWLFNTKKVDAIIEPKSIMHACVFFKDGSSVAHLSNPDMKLPIAYALSLHKKFKKNAKMNTKILPQINLCKMQKLEFKKIKTKQYPIWEIKNELITNTNLGVVLNASNEITVNKFLNKQISFLDISKINLAVCNKFNNLKIKNIDDVFGANEQIRQYAQKVKI